MKIMVYNPCQSSCAKQLIAQLGTNVDVFLRDSKTKGTNYNPKYEAGYTETYQNPISIKAYVRDKTADSLIINQLGLIAVGAKSVLINASDESYFRNAGKIQIDGEDYEVYNNATGKKVQIYGYGLGYRIVILFKSGN